MITDFISEINWIIATNLTNIPFTNYSSLNMCFI